MSIKPEDDFEGYMEELEERQLASERYLDMMDAHEVRRSTLAGHACVLKYSQLSLNTSFCSIVSRNGDKRRGWAGLFVSFRPPASILPPSLKLSVIPLNRKAPVGY